MKLTARTDVGLGALAVLLGGLTYVNTTTSADAALRCSDLSLCSGAAQCNIGGDLGYPCTLYCTGGGTIQCAGKSGG